MNYLGPLQALPIPDPWYRSPGRIAGAVFALALTILVVVAAAMFVVPRLMDGASLTVLSGSMRPSFAPGDVVVTRGVDQADVCSTVKIGQIVSYLPNPNDAALITHRVVSKKVGTYDDGTLCRLITQGDANTAVDAVPVFPAQVRGVYMYYMPRLGWAQQWVTERQQTLLVVGGLLMLAYLVWNSTRPARRTRVVAYAAAPAKDEETKTEPSLQDGAEPTRRWRRAQRRAAAGAGDQGRTS